MIILLANSDLFTRDPDRRFSEAQGVRPGVWRDLYRRRKLMGYSVQDIRDFYLVKCGKTISRQAVHDWLWRTDVYAKARPLIAKGARSVASSYFGEHEPTLVKQLTRNLAAGHRDSRALL